MSRKRLNADESRQIVDELLRRAKSNLAANASGSELWATLQKMLDPSLPFECHQLCYQKVYEGVGDVKPAWIPSEDTIQKTNIYKTMKKYGFETYQNLYEWSVGKESRDHFWMESMKNIEVAWENEPTAAFDMSNGGAAHVQYFPGGRLNISDSCFNKRDPLDPALVYCLESDPRCIRNMSFQTLDALSNQVANGITTKLNLGPGDAIGICMPMTPESVSIYLGIVKAGCVVVSIADSFSSEEIATRCRLGKAKAIFTQDVLVRGTKVLPLFRRVLEADHVIGEMEHTSTEGGDDLKETKSDDGSSYAPMRIVIIPVALHSGPYPESAVDDMGSTWTQVDSKGNPFPLHDSVLSLIRDDHDSSWYDLLHGCSEEFESVKLNSMDPCNILFSSGTTGEPKAIVWSHSTPIKCAIDGHYHHDIQVGDRVAWPTNIGWMMGPFLLFQLINGATIGLFNGITTTEAFCEFVDEAGISMLGVVPSLVKAWQAHNTTQNCDWSKIRRFSSTGEASDPVTCLWLMSRVPGYAPVLEYCGGTEIGGSFLSSTLVQPNVPSMFSSPVLGSQILLLDADENVIEACSFHAGTDGSAGGELVIVPPAIGLSTVLLNLDHYVVYYKGMPRGSNGEILRRHGDEVEYVRCSAHRSLGDGRNTSTPYYRALGRCDDTMNIGGIKVGSVEIERVCSLVEYIQETAAIAVSGPNGGPSKLVVYVVLEKGLDVRGAGLDVESVKTSMQKSLKARLNPLFGISDIVITDSLPRTASNKVMRRLLRDEYVRASGRYVP